MRAPLVFSLVNHEYLLLLPLLKRISILYHECSGDLNGYLA